MTASFVGFIGDAVPIERVIILPILISKVSTKAMVSLGFLVVHTPSAYNVILKRLRLNVL